MRREDVMPGLAVQARDDGSDGQARGSHIGTVIGLSDADQGGDYIEIQTEGAGAERRWIPFDWVNRVDDVTVYLDKTADEVEAASGAPGQGA